MYGEAKASNREHDHWLVVNFGVTCFAGKPAKHLTISRKLYCSKGFKTSTEYQLIHLCLPLAVHDSSNTCLFFIGSNLAAIIDFWRSNIRPREPAKL